MRNWDAARIALASGAGLLAPAAEGRAELGPSRVIIDSRLARRGDLFVGLRGERADGGEHAGEALAAGAWGVLVAPEHAGRLSAPGGQGAVLAHPDPLSALQALAGAWRRELGAAGLRVVGITGSTGKTS